MTALLVLAVLHATQPVLVPSPDVLPRWLMREPVPMPRKVAPAAEPPPDPRHARTARGSTKGSWGYAQTGIATGPGTFVDARRFGDVSADSLVVRGWGFERAGVRIVPSGAFGWTDELVGRGRGGWSALELRVAAPDLVAERLTKLRLTPVFGVTLPTAPAPNPLTQLSLAVQLERRFGPIEVAYRAQAGRDIFDGSPDAFDAWQLLNRILVEGWLFPSVSAAIGLGVLSTWRGFILDGSPALSQSDVFTASIQLNFALHPYAGVSFSMDTTQPTTNAAGQPVFPFYAAGAETQNLTSFGVRAWVRSDPILERNWLDR